MPINNNRKTFSVFSDLLRPNVINNMNPIKYCIKFISII